MRHLPNVVRALAGLAVLAAVLGVASRAQIGGGPVVGDPPHQGPYPHIRCICRFNGEEYGLGRVVCISTPGGSMLKRCAMHLNNTSWEPMNIPCTISARPMSRPLG